MVSRSRSLPAISSFLASSSSALVGGGGAGVGDKRGTENADPHFEIGRLLEEDVFLRREEPDERAAGEFVTPIGQQVGAGAAGDEVEF